MNLYDEFSKVAATRPDKIALITHRSQLTFKDLLGIAHILDMELSSRGVRPGQTLVLDTARAEMCLAFSLLLSLRGLTVIFASPVNVLAAKLEFDWVISLDTDQNDPAAKGIVIEAEWFQGLGALPSMAITRQAAGNGKFVTQSSGSTGVPKFIVGDERERVLGAKDGRAFVDVDLGECRFACTLSPSTSFGLTGNISTLLCGGSVLALDANVDNILPYLDMYRVNALVTTPARISQIVEEPGAAQFLSSVRHLRISGAAIGPELVARMEEICGAQIHIGFGAAETGNIFLHVHKKGTQYEPGFVGHKIRQQIQVGLFSDDGSLIEGDGEGQLGVRVDDADRKRDYLGSRKDDDNGYYLTGDILRRNENGYYFVGRTKNIINFSGNKYSLEKIVETLANRFPSQRIVAVPGVDDSGLELLNLICEGQSAPSPEVVQSYLAPHFRGMRVGSVDRCDVFPLTATGKIDIQKLIGQ